MQKEFYMIEVFGPGSYSVRHHKNGEVSKSNGVYSGRGCLIAVYREDNGQDNIIYKACRYNHDITGYEPNYENVNLLTANPKLAGAVEENLPKIIEMLGLS